MKFHRLTIIAAVVSSVSLSTLISNDAWSMSEADKSEIIQESSGRWMLERKEIASLAKNGKTAEAEKGLRKIIEERKALGLDTSGEKMEIALMLAKVKERRADAKKAFETILAEREAENGKDDPQVIWPLEEYASFLSSIGENKKALELKNRAAFIGKNQDKPPIKEVNEILKAADIKERGGNIKSLQLFNLGLKYVKRDRDIQARYCFDQAIKLDPSNALAYFERSEVNYRLGKNAQGKADINKAIALNPKMAKAYFRRAIFEEGENQNQLALADFSKAIECNPKDTESLGYRGKLNSEMGRNAEAVKDYTRVLAIDSTIRWARVQRGLAYVTLKEYEKAIDDFSNLVNRYPRNMDYYELRGDAYNKAGKFQLALNDYEQVIRLNPGYAGGHERKKTVLTKMGKKHG